MIFRRLAAFLLLSVLVSGFSLVGAQDAPLKVVVTYSILGDLVQNVAGENIELTVLVGPDADSHVYEPTPQDAIALAEADLIFENGLEFETWLDALYEASGSTAQRIVVSEGITPLAWDGEHDHDHEGHDHDHEGHDHDHEGHDHDHEGHDHDHEGHNHGEFDPHIWQDPNVAVVMVANIAAALSEADAANAETYSANAEAYTAELSALDAYIREQVEAIPAENRILVTSHETFAYFAAAYGFELRSISGLSTDAAEPGAGEIASLITELQAIGAPAVFTENIGNESVLEQIAREAGVKVGGALYTDALGQAGSTGENYLSMVRYNVDTIVEALQ